MTDDPPTFERLRVLTYNVRACKGRDRVRSPLRIAEVIASAAPDIVALQELDVRRLRSDRLDQAELIARELGMDFHFSPAMRVMEEEFGDAILTALPMRLVKAAALPGIRFPMKLERRGALWTEIRIGRAFVQMLNTHLGLTRRERRVQIDALCGAGWLLNPECEDPAILAGDFNFLSRSRTYARVMSRLQDAQKLAPSARSGATFPARYPRFRIDYIFVSPSIQVDRVEVIKTPATQAASDHLPVLADLRIPVRARRPATLPDAADLTSLDEALQARSRASEAGH
ncbi:endonuclease/exonuclease/phosphatase family protein [Bradyrhizobium sp. LHD-71]|uniref:endonuclease/exonuclease/phosphatase family protein n=1 Tax=Bradyrhizobium sp. LHD-71 TaxID=3072141 RepID=UPI00281022FF|nr:endonuclease/exonuclease/phosphatase family protein [Bradyrhizobium sp. LHD-71]MDQ8732134.1 endonuclease/exonuclease/phosphatase family protein [Bradyrhizobium sp. LHD-71]